MNIKSIYPVSSLVLLILLISGCTADEAADVVLPDVIENTDDSESSDDSENTEDDSVTDNTMCSEPLNFVFNESNGLVLAEFEDAEFTADWILKTDGTKYSGEGYMVWEGNQNLSNPGIGTATFKLQIENPGTYQFIWHSAVTIGDNGTDHNDTWLRFNDADDFYAQNTQGTSTVYPKDTGKTPNPEGATKDGWFKVYRSGNDLDFKWQSTTYDNNGHNVFVVFNNPGTYLMEISARSSGHGIDKFALFNSCLLYTSDAADDVSTV